jgi:hypothetical protein
MQTELIVLTPLPLQSLEQLGKFRLEISRHC